MNQKKRGQELRDAVVQIFGGSRIGNGFLLHNKKYYVICPADLVYPVQGEIHMIVPNVNGVNKSISYELTLHSLDIDGNLAVLVIDFESPFNKNNPHLMNHPSIKIGKSHNIHPGDSVGIIGNTIFSDKFDSSIISSATLINNKYSLNDNSIKGGLLLIDTTLGKYAHGLAIIDSNNKLIGIQIKSSDLMIVISEFFMRRPLKAMLNFDQSDKYQEFIIIKDGIRFYQHSCLGVKLTIDDQAQISQVTTPSVSSGDIKRISQEIIGYKILEINSQSELLDKLSLSDIITHINDTPLGIKKGQSCIANILWKIVPGTEIKITYLKYDQSYKYYNNILAKTLDSPLEDGFI